MRQLLTITWDLPEGYSVEAATALAERWTAGQLGGTMPRPVRIDSRAIPDGQPTEASATIADRRKSLHLTQRDLAHAAGLTAVTVSQIERGLIGPASQSAAALRRTLAELEAAR